MISASTICLTGLGLMYANYVRKSKPAVIIVWNHVTGIEGEIALPANEVAVVTAITMLPAVLVTAMTLCLFCE